MNVDFVAAPDGLINFCFSAIKAAADSPAAALKNGIANKAF